MTKEITLSNGMCALVDDEDFEELSSFSWYMSSYGYAARRPLKNGKLQMIMMHRQILGLGKEDRQIFTDHVNGNRLDNRRSNLRTCTQAQNNRNRPRQVNNTTGYKGVSKASATTFRAQIKVNGKKIRIGTYKTAEEAYRAYCDAAKKYHGEFYREDSAKVIC